VNIWLVSPAWRRFAVTELALAERRWLCDELTSRGLSAHGVIVGDDDNLEIAEHYGFDRVEFPNDRGLGAKFNAGFKHALDNGADYVIHIGSDDWVHPDFFDLLPLPPWEKPMPAEPSAASKFFPRPGAANVIVCKVGAPALTTGGISLCYLPTGEALWFGARRPWGVVPWALSRDTFDGVEFPVEPTILKGVEGSMIRQLPHISWQQNNAHRLLGVDWKSGTNVTPFDGLRMYGEPYPDFWDDLAALYPSRLVEMARHTSLWEAADGRVRHSV
jgi:glycosyltransferase involved in cell wall biosynthesis